MKVVHHRSAARDVRQILDHYDYDMRTEPEPVSCHLCGQEFAIEVDGLAWCAGCLHAKGSCCGESEMESCEETGKQSGGSLPDEFPEITD